MAALVVLSAPSLPGMAETDVSAVTMVQEFYGPLRSRDLSPFGYLRLDMRPAFTGTLAPGNWAVESELAYQNTWAMSDPVEHYLASRTRRGDLTRDDVAAILELPGENYLVDLEMAELDVTVHRQLSRHWGAYLVLAGVSYGGGVLDGTIEQFHSAFGMSNYGRRAVSRGQINVVFDLDSLRYESVDASTRNGLLDPILGARYTGVALPAPWTLALEGAVKLPVAGQRTWLSTGRADFGLQASLMRRGPRHAVIGTFSLVDYAGSDSRMQPDERLLPTVVVGLDSHLTRHMHSILQFYASPSVYDHGDTQVEALRANKYQLSFGLRHHRGGHLLTIAVTENVANFNNTPDVGLQLGWAYRPAR
jgi:hypothetical protein